MTNKRNSSQDSKIGERERSSKSNLQCGVILKVPSSGSAPVSEDSETCRDLYAINQQQRKNGSIFVPSHKGEY